MMHRFVAVEKSACRELISDRTFQSELFDNGEQLLEVLRGDRSLTTLGAKLHFVNDGGLFLLTPGTRSDDYIIFDAERANIFAEDDALLFFQKSLRFAVKQWDGLRVSITERPLPNSSKAIIFPFPISKHTSFRISIELSPNNRLSNRSLEPGRCLLVYRMGVDEGDGPQEEANNVNYRRFLESRRRLPEIVTSQSSTALGIPALSVTRLDRLTPAMPGRFYDYQTLMKSLTSKQREFVTADLLAPHRIEGAAGTGKTLSLVLKAITALQQATESGSDYNGLFVTHSEATRRNIEDRFSNLYPDFELRESGTAKLRLATLQELCAEFLRDEVTEQEFLDRDAMDSKQLQVLYVEEALKAVFDSEFPSYKKLLSPGFRMFLENTDRMRLSEMVQHEISIVIKGRAEEQLERYRKLPRLPYGLPIESSQDRGFIWGVFERYQSYLAVSAQYDTDDIVLTAIGQLDTPIWRRRRPRDGYSAIYVDETHLFNMNELSIFHFLTRSSQNVPIAFSVDRSQAIGDRDWSDFSLDQAIAHTETEETVAQFTNVDAIFRSSPEIVNLAFSITSAGATLFTNFDDPLSTASSIFTAEEERRSILPTARLYGSDEEMIASSFLLAESAVAEMHSGKADVAIIAFTDDLFRQIERFARDQNKPVEVLRRRGDVEVVRRAEKSGRFVVSTPDYVGGLEFDAVVLVGVDKGRVPPTRDSEISDSANFLSYAAHSRLYVAISRAKYRVMILGLHERGLSKLLQNALAGGGIKLEGN